MEDDRKQYLLKQFVSLENHIRQIFKQKLDSVPNEVTPELKRERAGALWRSDQDVLALLTELKSVADEINDKFLEYTLIDFLKLFYFFTGFHEELFYQIEKSHPITDLIRKSAGYCFNNTSGFIINRVKTKPEATEMDNRRAEMCITYLMIFAGRILFSPYRGKLIEYTEHLDLNLKLREIAANNTNIPYEQISKEKTGFMTVLEGSRSRLLSFEIPEEELKSLFIFSIKNIGNLISASNKLKESVYHTSWKIIRPSFFEPCREGITTKTYMCRIYEGPTASEEFPFSSIIPSRYELF